MDIEVLTKFLAWSSTLNMALLIFSWIMLMALRKTVSPLHAKMFGLSEDEVARQYFHYLAQYKIAIIVFNLVPYLVLRMII